MITVTPLPAFSDNYIWLIEGNGHAAVIDPGDADVVTTALGARGLKLSAVLITHHHSDHTGGIATLKAAFPALTVYGPRAETARISGIDHAVDDGDTVTLDVLGLRFEVLAVPGHTAGHVAYYAATTPGQTTHGILFSGDTLFAAGCGRLFEGTATQMHESLARLGALPGDTHVYCAHEYTLSNLAFAAAVEPNSAALQAEIARVRALRDAGTPSVPSTIDRERSVNPFLRCEIETVAEAATATCGIEARDPVAVFATLRRWKDSFRANSAV